MEMTARMLRALQPFRFFPATANLPLFPVRIFEKYRVVAGAVIDAQLGAFHVFPTRFADDFGDLVDGGATLRPKSDAIAVWLVIGFFGETKEWDRLPGGLKLTPFLTALVDLETDRGQDLSVERWADFAIRKPIAFSKDLYAQINVIKVACLHFAVVDFRLRRRFSRRTINFNPDQVSSTAQTFTSTKPSGNATSRITSSVTSVATPEDFFGHETQRTPVSAINLRSRFNSFFERFAF